MICRSNSLSRNKRKTFRWLLTKVGVAMGSDNKDQPPTVELRVRNLTPANVHDLQAAVLSRLQALKSREKIREYSISVWGKLMNTSSDKKSTVAATDSVATVREFEAWAANNDYSLEPGFRRRELTSLLDETPCEVIEVPILCLAVYSGGKLEAVYPHSASETVYTVDDGLDALETERTWGSRKVQPA